VFAARLSPEQGREATEGFLFLAFFLLLFVSEEGGGSSSSSEVSCRAGDFFGEPRGWVAELRATSLRKPTEAAGGGLMVRCTRG
jgi:hypothetical protein